MGTSDSVAACPSCATPVAERDRFCPGCGSSLDVDSPTGTAPRRLSTPGLGEASRGVRSSGGASSERFPPGTVLLDRYRLVGLLGRGGMGEVYRADDLKLEQPVALKFLPRTLERDPERLDRLFAEVRMARQVSHPAVCRVWDVGEAEGQHFLSMEFVDGENLASLLRRIGRLPGDKALDIARQLCAGLAAAHEKGVLHRDLKPANVMLDGQGKVRLTDFGLAALALAPSGEDVRSGTPTYMSPEQLQGREVSVRSDVYSLGLVLYELFTGRRVFEGRSLAEVARRHREERPLEPSALLVDIDPAVERAILACLEKEPRKRPPSALAVAAMLAGRDPLQASIEAGETPSPELVAAAGEAEGLRRPVAWACLALTLAGVLILPAVNAERHLLSRVPTDRSPAALEDRARDLVARVATGVTAVDAAADFAFDSDLVEWTRARDRTSQRWKPLAQGDPPLVTFWYRQSPRPLASSSLGGEVGWSDPPARLSGMVGVEYDLLGRLLTFYRVPPQRERDGDAPRAAPDWAPLFAEARLDPAALKPVEPRWLPPFYCDTRAAWEGTWPRRPEIPLRVEAAAYRGQPVSFLVVSPWTRAEREEAFPLTRTQRAVQGIYIGVLLLLVGTGAVLARRNILLGRVDRRGAARLAIGVATLACLSWALRAHHVVDPAAEIVLAARGAGTAVLVAALLWLFHLALEPYVRRLRPWTLVSWTRLLDGGWRDAVVGRDVLIGTAAGTLLAALSLFVRELAVWLQRPDPVPGPMGLDALLSTRRLLAYVTGLPVNATLIGLGLLLLFLLLRLLTRRDLVAAALVAAFMVAGDVGSEKENVGLFLPFSAAAWGAVVAVLLRFGLLAATSALLTANFLLFPPLLYASGWTGAAVPVLVPLVCALAVLAFRSAQGGHSGLRRYLAGDAPSRPS